MYSVQTASQIQLSVIKNKFILVNDQIGFLNHTAHHIHTHSHGSVFELNQSLIFFTVDNLIVYMYIAVYCLYYNTTKHWRKSLKSHNHPRCH